MTDLARNKPVINFRLGRNGGGREGGRLAATIAMVKKGNTDVGTLKTCTTFGRRKQVRTRLLGSVLS